MSFIKSNPFRFRRRSSSVLSSDKMMSSSDDQSIRTEASSCLDDRGFEDALGAAPLATTPEKALTSSANETEEDDELHTASLVITTTSYSSTCQLMYPSPQHVTQATCDLFSALQALIQSREFQHLKQSTVQWAQITTQVAVQGAMFFPITVPRHVAGQTVQVVQILSQRALAEAAALLLTTKTSRRTVVQKRGNATETVEEVTHKESTLQEEGAFGVLFNIVTLPPRLLVGAAEKLKEEVGSAVTSIIGMEAPKQQPCKKDDNFLDRLRLDFVEPDDSQEVQSSFEARGEAQAPLKIKGTTKFLLRVNDLNVGIMEQNGKKLPVYYIDLSDPSSTKDTSEKKAFLTIAMDRMVEQGLYYSSASVGQPPQNSPSNTAPIKWKQECSTNKIMRRLAKCTSKRERVEVLSKDMLVWSGEQKGSNNPFFMARGIVPARPHQVLHQLWENSRTCEYNKYCLGRKTLLNLEDSDLFHGASRGTKVIHSETRVPFTGISLSMACLMHARPLPEGNGFLIVSRSLHPGEAGSSAHPLREKTGNEILWGLNILRTVPGHPLVTDLTSFSQVQSASVPRFLAQRIAILGVEDFFKNMRQHNNKLGTNERPETS